MSRQTDRNDAATAPATRLEPCRDEDVAQILHWVDSEDLMAFWAGGTFRWPLSGAELHEYLERSRRPDSPMRVYRVVSAETGEWIGHVDLCPSVRNDRSGQIGRVLIGDPRLRGRGIGRRMMAQVLDIAFFELDLWRVELHVAKANPRARRCYRSLGFHRVRGMTLERMVGETKYPTIRMALDRETWQKRRPQIVTS